MMVMGVPIGYSSPNTLTDKSTKIKKATKALLEDELTLNSSVK
jgi:hypothetical protein